MSTMSSKQSCRFIVPGWELGPGWSWWKQHIYAVLVPFGAAFLHHVAFEHFMFWILGFVPEISWNDHAFQHADWRWLKCASHIGGPAPMIPPGVLLRHSGGLCVQSNVRSGKDLDRLLACFYCLAWLHLYCARMNVHDYSILFKKYSLALGTECYRCFICCR